MPHLPPLELPLCVFFLEGDVESKFRSAENLKLNTVGRAGWSMLGELRDSWRWLVVNSRAGAAGAGSTGTGREGRLRIDGSNTGLGSMRTRYSSELPVYPDNPVQTSCS